MGRPLNLSAAVRLALLSCSPLMGARANLPVPCLAGSCGAAVTGFVTSGQATAVQSGSRLTVNQTSSTAVLNWQSFNIANGSGVQFVQPSASAVALNQIFDSNPTQIFGSLNANGRVFLINQNGIVFGAGAQVNIGGLLASTLSINPDRDRRRPDCTRVRRAASLPGLLQRTEWHGNHRERRNAADRPGRGNPDLCARNSQSGHHQHAGWADHARGRQHYLPGKQQRPEPAWSAGAGGRRWRHRHQRQCRQQLSYLAGSADRPDNRE